MTPPPTPALSPRTAAHELWRSVHQTVRTDAFTGVLLLLATVGAVVAANSPWAERYAAVRDTVLGPHALHLDLSVGQWAADGLLAIFFFVVGLELKEEIVAGRLRDLRAAALPVLAAVGGVVVPALVLVAVQLTVGTGDLRGWAIPTATDIAFAIAVLAVVGRHLPPALRVFLITLAIVDDLIAIVVIALFYSSGLHLPLLAAALLPLALFGVAVRRGVRVWWVLLPLALLTWGLVHASGVHATIAGVLLGLVVPVHPTERAHVEVEEDDGETSWEGMAAHLADRWGPVSGLVAVPVFAFFSAGVPLGGVTGLREALTDPLTLGVAAGLVLGKPVGILGTTWLATRLPGLRLGEGLRWPDLAGLGAVAGIGFTVSLLIGELSYGQGEVGDRVKVGVLVGSLVAAVVGGALLAWRDAGYRREAGDR